MKKLKSVIAILLIMACIFNSGVVYAHKDQSKHYEEIEAVLFNDRLWHISAKGDDKKLHAVRILEYATTLCIDQAQRDSNKNLLTALKCWGVREIPDNVNDLLPAKGTTQLSAKNHRTYTHQGWDYDYSKEKDGDKANWEIRKRLMLSSVEKVFDFSLISGEIGPIDFEYSGKCKSFSALLYYIHIAGDYLGDVDEKKGNIDKFNGDSNGKTIPFASSASKPFDVFSELKKNLEVLFRDQLSSNVYKSLISDLDALASKARRLSEGEDGKVSETNYSQMQECVQELMNILTGENNHYNAIHQLLMNEEFFTDVFY